MSYTFETNSKIYNNPATQHEAWWFIECQFRDTVKRERDGDDYELEMDQYFSNGAEYDAVRYDETINHYSLDSGKFSREEIATFIEAVLEHGI